MATNDNQQDSGGGRFGTTDVLSDTFAALGPIQPTAVDALGVERIVGPGLDAWTPAPVEPHPDDIAHREKVDALLQERRAQRLDAFKSADPAGADAAAKSQSGSKSTSKSS